MTRLFALLALVIVTNIACGEGKFQSPTAPTSTLVDAQSQQVSARVTSTSSMMIEGRPLVWTVAQGFNPRPLPVESETYPVVGYMPSKTALLAEAYIETTPNGKAILVKGEILKASWSSSEAIRCEGSVDGDFLEIIKTQDFIQGMFVAQGLEWHLAQLDNLRREEFRAIDPSRSTPEDRALYKKLCS